MRSRGLFLPWAERTGVDDGSSRPSGEGGAPLAFRIAPSLAAEDGVTGSRPGDLDAASLAAISEVDEGDEAKDRPLKLNVLAEGESDPVVNLPILSLTEPTSGPMSDPVL